MRIFWLRCSNVNFSVFAKSNWVNFSFFHSRDWLPFRLFLHHILELMISEVCVNCSPSGPFSSLVDFSSFALKKRRHVFMNLFWVLTRKSIISFRNNRLLRKYRIKLEELFKTFNSSSRASATGWALWGRMWMQPEKTFETRTWKNWQKWNEMFWK